MSDKSGRKNIEYRRSGVKSGSYNTSRNSKNVKKRNSNNSRTKNSDSKKRPVNNTKGTQYSQGKIKNENRFEDEYIGSPQFKNELHSKRDSTSRRIGVNGANNKKKPIPAKKSTYIKSKNKKGYTNKEKSIPKDSYKKAPRTDYRDSYNDFWGKSINNEYDDRYYDSNAVKKIHKKKPPTKLVSKKARRIRTIILSALITTVVLVAGITLSLTVFFKTAEYEVTGKTRYDKQEIINACGIALGENIFLADKSSSEQKIIDAFPYIETADVSFGLPDKIVISVTEGKPFYLVEYSKNQYCVVSKEGRILKLSDKKIDDLPIIIGVKLKSNVPGTYVEYNNEKTSHTLEQLVESLDKNGFTNLSEINVSDKANLTFTYDNRIVVELGLPEDLDYKIRTAKIIIFDKLDPNNTGVIEGTLDVSKCNETKRSYFNEKSIVPDAQEASTTATDPTATTTPTDVYGNVYDGNVDYNYSDNGGGYSDNGVSDYGYADGYSDSYSDSANSGYDYSNDAGGYSDSGNVDYGYSDGYSDGYSNDYADNAQTAGDAYGTFQ